MASRMGLVALASKLELGGERSDELLEGTAASLRAAGIDLVVGDRIVENIADALAVCEQFKESGITSLVMIDVTWQGDSLKYLFTQRLSLPTLYWAVPYADTFSMACVQHYISVLTMQGIPAKWVYGAPDDPEAIRQAVLISKAGYVIDEVKNSTVALVGPRNAWRVAGAAEMVNEEWELSRKLGLTIIHLEMEEITDIAETITDEAARETLDVLSLRTGKVNASGETMLWMAKLYHGLKAVVAKYKIDVVVAECYPRYSGLLNTVASWVADEGLVVETEGDIGGALVMHVLNKAAEGDAVSAASVLAETGSFNEEEGWFSFAHVGSTAPSYANDIGSVVIQQMGDGTQVCFPVRAMSEVTVGSLVGARGEYKMLVAQAATLEATQEEWNAAGARLLAKLRFNEKPRVVLDTMVGAGIDHHWILKEGDYSDLLRTVCDYLGIETLSL